jgi:hypothetical protein
MKLVKRLKRTGDQLLFADDIRAILLNPLLHSRGTIKVALAVFTKVNSVVASVYKPYPKLFVELAMLFDTRGDERMVLHVLAAAALSRVSRPIVETHKLFLLALFHKSDALRRHVFMYIASSPRFKGRGRCLKLRNNGILNDMAALVTAEDIDFLQKHGRGVVKRVCSTITNITNTCI